MFGWDDLRTIGQSWPSRVSILIPFIGNFIIFNEFVSKILVTALKIPGDFYSNSPEMNFNLSITTLYVFYIGLVLFGVASCLYQIGSSKIVKKFDSSEDYVVGYRDSVTAEYLFESIDIIRRSQLADTRKDELGLDAAEVVLHEMDPNSTEARKTVNLILKTRYEVESLRYPPLRFLSTLSYASAFCLLVFPSLLTFYRATIIFVSE